MTTHAHTRAITNATELRYCNFAPQVATGATARLLVQLCGPRSREKSRDPFQTCSIDRASNGSRLRLREKSAPSKTGSATARGMVVSARPRSFSTSIRQTIDHAMREGRCASSVRGTHSQCYWTMGKQQPWTQDVCAGQVAPSGFSTHSVTPGSHSVPVPAQKVTHFSPESPPLFWSPSWAMT